MKCDALFSKIDELEADYIKVWEEFCNIESPTSYKEGVDAAGKYMIRKAEEFGWKVEVFPQTVSGDCVCITMNPDAPKPPIALSGHIDTVHPVGLFGTPAVHFEDDKIYGPGVVDCKGGVVASLYAMAALQECGFTDRPVMLLLQSDEEVGSRFSGKATIGWICQKAKDAVAFLNCEGFHDKIILERKGIQRYEFTVKGVSAHSSGCYDGVNAIAEAAHKILELEKFKDKDGITCSCNIISGGTAPNTVPETCTVIADFRIATREQMEQVEQKVQEVASTSYIEGSACTAQKISYRVAMEASEKNDKLFEHINKIYGENGLPILPRGKTRGGSDAADVTAFGIPCVDSLGTQGKHIHRPDEYSFVSSLSASAKRLASIVYCFDE